MLAEVPTVLDSLVKTDPSLRPLIDRLDPTQLRSRAWNDGKVSAHHGIIPTLEPANLSAMNDKELAVHRLIRALPRAVPPTPRVRPDGGAALLRRQSLAAVGKQIAVTGWRQVLAVPEPDDAGWRRRPAQPGAAGAACRLVLPGRQVDLKALKTLPPKPYTQGELVKGHEDRRQDRPAPETEAQDTTASAPKRRAPTSSAA